MQAYRKIRKEKEGKDSGSHVKIYRIYREIEKKSRDNLENNIILNSKLRVDERINKKLVE